MVSRPPFVPRGSRSSWSSSRGLKVFNGSLSDRSPDKDSRGNEENRVIRPPRQTCHRKGSGANRYNRNDRHNRQQVGDEGVEPDRRKGASVGRVYRKVSFNGIHSVSSPPVNSLAQTEPTRRKNGMNSVLPRSHLGVLASWWAPTSNLGRLRPPQMAAACHPSCRTNGQPP